MSSYLMLTTKHSVVFYSDTRMTTSNGVSTVTKIFKINNRVLIACLKNNTVAGIHFNDLVSELQNNCSKYSANQIKGYLLSKFNELKNKIDLETTIIIVTSKRNKINTLRIDLPNISLPQRNEECFVWDSSGNIDEIFYYELKEKLKNPFNTTAEANLFARDMFQRTEDELKRKGSRITTSGFDYKEIFFKDKS